MENLLQLLRELIQDEERVQTAFVALTALTLFLFGAGITFFLVGVSDPVRHRIRNLSGRKHRKLVTASDVSRVLAPVAPFLLPKKAQELSATERALVHAGFRSPNAATIFYALKTLFGVLLPALVVAGSQFIPELSASRVLFFALLASALGVTAPSTVLRKLVDRRQRKLRHGFPDALDLLVVCVESGLGLTAAIQRVSRELPVSHPELGEELALVNAEIRAGVERVEALKNLSDRTGLEDIRGLVSLLVQSMRFGTSIAETLRVYAEEFRDKRMQAAEEMAAKVSTKIIFPLVFCFFPAFFLVAVGPAILRIMSALGVLGAS